MGLGGIVPELKTENWQHNFHALPYIQEHPRALVHNLAVDDLEGRKKGEQ